MIQLVRNFMEKDNKILQDISKLASSAFVTVVNAKNDLSQYIKYQIESFIKSMDFISREEFEVVKKLAAQNQLELQELKSKLNFPKDKLVAKKKAPLKAKNNTSTDEAKMQKKSSITKVEV